MAGRVHCSTVCRVVAHCFIFIAKFRQVPLTEHAVFEGTVYAKAQLATAAEHRWVLGLLGQ
jgi:hypothetical protein